MLILSGLLSQYKDSGLQVIGVNLDSTEEEMQQFLAGTPFPWPQIHEPGGTAGRLATEMGIMNPPLLILVDKAGRVVNRNATAANLDNELRNLLQ